MSERVEVSTDIAASPEKVWAMVADLTQMGRWSPENEGAEWLRGASGPVVGATFKGVNRRGTRTWNTHGTITEATKGRALAFLVNVGPFKVAEWRYQFEPTDGGCVVTESMVDQRSALTSFLGKLTTGVEDRGPHNKETMEHTLAQLKAAAESSPTAS